MGEDFNIKKIIAEAKQQLSLELNYGKLTAVEKISILLSRIALVGTMAILGSFALFFIVSTFASMLAVWTGSTLVANAIVVALLLCVLFVVYVFRKQWIINPITRFVCKLFLNPNDHE